MEALWRSTRQDGKRTSWCGSLRTPGSDTHIPVASDDGVVRFVAHDVPAMGYRTYVEDASQAVVPGHLDADREGHELTSPYFKVALDPQPGTIRSLIDRRTGRQLVDGWSDYGLRLWELAGRGGPGEIRLPTTLEAWRERTLDLRGQPLRQWQPIAGGPWTIDLGAFAPQAYQIERQ